MFHNLLSFISRFTGKEEIKLSWNWLFEWTGYNVRKTKMERDGMGSKRFRQGHSTPENSIEDSNQKNNKNNGGL